MLIICQVFARYSIILDKALHNFKMKEWVCIFQSWSGNLPKDTVSLIIFPPRPETGAPALSISLWYPSPLTRGHSGVESISYSLFSTVLVSSPEYLGQTNIIKIYSVTSQG